MDDELKRMVEAVLFAAARKLELSEIAKLCKRPEQDILSVLTEWKEHLDASSSPTMLVQDGDSWKLTVREKYVSVIKKVVTKTELPKGHMETLAVVAYKAPVLQSKVIKIRTNKAYDHLAQLENSGFITREKSGRTKLIKLTPKFFEYFDIDPSRLRQKFGSATDVEKAIENKEKEIEQIEEIVRKQAEERLGTPKIVLEPDKGKPKELETYPSVQPVEEMLPTGVQLFMEKLGDLDVYDVPLESIPPGERPHPHKKHHRKTTKKHPHKVHHEEEKPEPEAEPVAEEPQPEKAEEPETVEEKPAEKPEEPKVEEKPEEPEIPEQKIAKEVAEKTKKAKPKEFEKGKGLFPKGVPPEVEAKIEERIQKMLHGQPEEKESEEEEKEE